MFIYLSSHLHSFMLNILKKKTIWFCTITAKNTIADEWYECMYFLVNVLDDKKIDQLNRVSAYWGQLSIHYIFKFLFLYVVKLSYFSWRRYMSVKILCLFGRLKKIIITNSIIMRIGVAKTKETHKKWWVNWNYYNKFLNVVCV